jgi:transposase
VLVVVAPGWWTQVKAGSAGFGVLLALLGTLSSLAYEFLGEEVIEIADGEVRVRRQLFELPVLRTASYPLEALNARFVAAGQEGRRSSRIAMQVAGQHSSMAPGIGAMEAGEIVAEIGAQKRAGTPASAPA